MKSIIVNRNKNYVLELSFDKARMQLTCRSYSKYSPETYTFYRYNIQRSDISRVNKIMYDDDMSKRYDLWFDWYCEKKDCFLRVRSVSRSHRYFLLSGAPSRLFLRLLYDLIY